MIRYILGSCALAIGLAAGPALADCKAEIEAFDQGHGQALAKEIEGNSEVGRAVENLREAALLLGSEGDQDGCEAVLVTLVYLADDYAGGGADGARAEQQGQGLAQQSEAEQTEGEQAKAQQAEGETEQAQAEQTEGEQAKAQQAEAETEQAQAEQTEGEQAKAQKAEAETEQAQAEQTEGEQAKAQQAEAETEQAQAEQTEGEQAKAQQAEAETEQAQAEQTEGEQAKAQQAEAEAEQAQAEQTEGQQAQAEQNQAQQAESTEAGPVQTDQAQEEEAESQTGQQAATGEDAAAQEGAAEVVVGQQAQEIADRTVAFDSLDTRFDAARLLDREVRNYDDTLLGKVDGVLVSTESGLSHVLVEQGGFLGIGKKKIAIPVTRLQWNPEEEIFYLNLSEEQLGNAPEYDTKNEWVAEINDRWYDDPS